MIEWPHWMIDRLHKCSHLFYMDLFLRSIFICIDILTLSNVAMRLCDRNFLGVAFGMVASYLFQPGELMHRIHAAGDAVPCYRGTWFRRATSPLLYYSTTATGNTQVSGTAFRAVMMVREPSIVWLTYRFC